MRSLGELSREYLFCVGKLLSGNVESVLNIKAGSIIERDKMNIYAKEGDDERAEHYR